MGTVQQPYNLCDLNILLFDASHQLKFEIHGSVWQCGVCCSQFPCKKCQKVRFSINDPTKSYQIPLNKVSAGCLKSAFTDLVNMQVGFPPNAT